MYILVVFAWFFCVLYSFSYYSMQMMPPHIAMMQGQGGPAKPLFPSAVPVSSPGAQVVGADFKPITSGIHYLFYIFFKGYALLFLFLRGDDKCTTNNKYA